MKLYLLFWIYGHKTVGMISIPVLQKSSNRKRIPLRRGVLDTTLCDKLC